jgi:LysM repeat protein
MNKLRSLLPTLALLLPALALLVLLIGAAPGLASTPAGQATCAQTYTVVRGDTLSTIARRFGTTVAELVRLNNIANRNLIRVNQVLCVAASPPPTPLPTPPAPAGAVAVEATFAITVTVDAVKMWQLEPRAGTRVSFPLTSGRAGVETIGASADILQAAAANRPVVLWVNKAPGETGYTLVSVGADEPLVPLRLKRAGHAGPLVPPGQRVCRTDASFVDDVLGAPGTALESLNLWLEAPNGLRYPLTIDCIAHEASPADAAQFYANPVLALIADGQGAYVARVILSNSVTGPPGLNNEQFCKDNAGNDNWPYPWLLAMAGCP